MATNDILSQPIGIIGTGAAAIIATHVLLQDGFTDVTLISRDKSVGGVWARERVYPGLYTNNIHGEYRFSGFEMPIHDISKAIGGRLTGEALCEYMESYSKLFLQDKVKFCMETEVLNITRNERGTWLVKTQDLRSKAYSTMTFARIVLATGGCSNPRSPETLSSEAARKAQFKGVVVHTSEFAPRMEDILAAAKPKIEDPQNVDTVVVIGGGKSALDMCTILAKQGRKVTMVFETPDVFFATPKPLPAFIRKSRYLSILSPHIHLKTRLERFLHTTYVGGAITRFLWKKMGEGSFDAYEIPMDSPLRLAESPFWSVRSSDEGTVRPGSFHALVMSGEIEIVAPARAIGYSDDGKSVILSNGRELEAKVILLATGYQSSWTMFEKSMAEELGIAKHAPTNNIEETWNYPSLQDPPNSHPENENWVTTLYRGIVPAKNIARRDFALAGAMLTVNPGYTYEVAAHWISSYFLSDTMRLPSTPEDALREAERVAKWANTRYPQVPFWHNGSHTGGPDLWTWPQAADELLEDMYLPSLRSGGNWFTWPFKVIDIKELASLGEERRVLRTKK